MIFFSGKSVRQIPVVLLIFSCSASAEWVFVSETSDKERFIESSSIEREGNRRKFWVLSNFKDGGQSVIHFFEVECKKRQARTLQGHLFEKLWAEGKLVGTYKEDLSIEYIVPGSSGETMLKYACSK